MTSLIDKYFRLFILLNLGLMLAAVPGESFAQSEESDERSRIGWILSKTRTEITPDYRQFSNVGTQQAAVQVAQTVPMGIGRSSLSLQSRISLFHGGIGTRTHPANDRSLRWSAGFLHTDLYRAPVAVGVSVLEYDRLGRFDLEARWLDVRVGPSVRLSNTWGAIESRVVGSVGGASLKPGSVHYPSLNDRADDTFHGFDTSYRAEIAARLNHWLLVSIGAGQRILLDRQNLRIDGARAEIQTVFWPQLQLFAQFRRDRLQTGENSASGRYFRTGLRIAL